MARDIPAFDDLDWSYSDGELAEARIGDWSVDPAIFAQATPLPRPADGKGYPIPVSRAPACGARLLTGMGL